MTDWLARARAAALSRPGVAELARGLDVQEAKAAARVALASAGAQVALSLAFAIASAGAKLETSLVRALVPELDDIDLTGPLVFAADEPVAAILGVLEDRAATLEHEAYCVLLAAEALGGAKPPPALLVHARYLARHDLDAEARACLGAAAQRLSDPSFAELAASFIATAKRSRKLVEELLGKARRAPLDSLPEVSSARVTGGAYTVRRAKEVGRNDPCPCGSGQKYKKCHAGRPLPGENDDALDAATMMPDQAGALRPSELARVDVSRLSTEALLHVLRRATALRRWDVVLRALEVAGARPGLADAMNDLRITALSAALDAHAREPAERLAASLPEGIVDASLELGLLRSEPDVLARLERTAERALVEEGDGATMIELAHVILRQFPALGVLVGRGAVHEGRPKASQALLEQIEDARDKLLLPPFEPWWDVFDAMVERPESEGKKGEDARALATELRRARAQSRKASTEIAQLKERLAELDVALGGARLESGGRPPKGDKSDRRDKSVKPASESGPARPEPPRDPALEEERRRLRTKVEELQRIIGEGQEERRELRRKLEEMAEADARDESEAVRRGADEDERGDEDERAFEDAREDEPRGVLVPVFTDRAGKALGELSGPAADVVLSVVAGLASSRDNAWSGVKRLEKAKTVHSARAGIHYRVLFTVDDGVLRVHEVVHRRDLEQAVNRMVRIA